MNKDILDSAVQTYIHDNLNADVHQIAMAKSPFAKVSGQELAAQIAARKKTTRKLPTWFHTAGIYYPPLLSVEQCSSELTAAFKATLVRGESLIDLTGGYGVDSYYFAKQNTEVIHCEINAELSEIAAYNAPLLGQHNTTFLGTDGIAYLQDTNRHFDTVYIDPARRSNSGKVFMLKDCTPNVIEHLDLLLKKSNRILIKTAPLLDISAGLKELKGVVAVHIISVKNECKELIWIVEKESNATVKIVCTTLNQEEKHFSYYLGEESPVNIQSEFSEGDFLYEPDVALLKGGAFNLIAERYQLKKIHAQTQLYTSPLVHKEFPGRIFKIEELLSGAKIKKAKDLKGSVIVRNYPAQAAALVSKYQIKPDDNQYIIFTQSADAGKLILKCSIIQHY